MDKIKKEQGNLNSRSMLDQNIGSALDIKTNEDFNNEHPDHDESGFIKENHNHGGSNTGKDDKQTADIK